MLSESSSEQLTEVSLSSPGKVKNHLRVSPNTFEKKISIENEHTLNVLLCCQQNMPQTNMIKFQMYVQREQIIFNKI